MKRKLAVLTGMLVLAVLLFGCFNQPNVAPVAEFACLTENPVVGEPTVFDASASLDPDGSIVSYQWDFGGITISPDSGPRCQYWFAESGTVAVTLTVTDNDGASTISILHVEVAPIVGEPVISIQNLDAPGNNFCTCERIRVELKNVLGPCTIDWGDGQRDIGNSAEHYYKEPAPLPAYTYQFVVTDSRGNEVYNRSIYIEACCLEPPMVSISIPKFVAVGDRYRVEAEDPDQRYTYCNQDIPRPICQECGAYQVSRGPANDVGICLILARFYRLGGGARQELANVQELDLENSVLRIPNLAPSWYEVELIVVDDDSDCEDGRQRVVVVPIKVE